jgi:hypothetical protein
MPGYLASDNVLYHVGEEAAWRYVEFLTANIRNPPTRRAYARACARFFAWCEDPFLWPAAIRPPRRRGLYKPATERGLGTLGQAAARRNPGAVRLAGDRPGRADQPGGAADTPDNNALLALMGKV